MLPNAAFDGDESFVVAADDADTRLDVCLARRVAGHSRSRLQALVREGHVRVSGRVITEPSHRVKQDDTIEVSMPPPVDATPLPEAIPLDILFEDEHLIVLVKPAGIVMHPAPGHASGTMVNALLAHCGASLSGIGGVKRPGIVHRLDRDVSGVIVVAKHDRAHVALSAQFTVHSIDRYYEAIIWGVPALAADRIDRPIGRDPRDRLKMTITGNGKRAVTDYRLIEAAGVAASRVELKLMTGRTHQIRVHLTSLGHPILGDRVYTGRHRPLPPGPAREKIASLDRLALHARDLGFVHPVSGQYLHFRRDPPPLFAEMMTALRT
ncbi:ribosomal large subunit pseudouridine synthase D [Arboricoccus pini]|uniref:Pseudouridine synthase n=1 Tax=Arboricoccus pini TaxID=1963835 RepID=A0A212QUL1_9PROT|nr:RluA family pseudouridine synthase [Arboricoccus pini]SNB63355.1 ribosomal large subunit pseudouridine synthase D [Arboricoccus pini]